MAQQKGFKRAIKVADRNRRKSIQQKEANFRRAERQEEVAAKELTSKK